MTVWQTPQCPFSIEFAPDRLDEIRLAVVDGYYAVPRGGVEIGGVLFGKVVGRNVLIHDYRKIQTEYLSGPSFRLSDTDLAGLRALLTDTKFRDPEIRPVGWFVSHTRTAIDLREIDREIYQSFFPGAKDVVLVLKPDSTGKVRAGYFFREADGSVKADASVSEFPVEAYWGAKQAPPPEASVAVVEDPVFAAAFPRIAEKPKFHGAPREVPPLPVPPTSPPSVKTVAAPAPEVPAAAPEVAPLEVSSPAAAQPGAWSLKKQLLLPLLVVAALVAALTGYWFATH